VSKDVSIYIKTWLHLNSMLLQKLKIDRNWLHTKT